MNRIIHNAMHAVRIANLALLAGLAHATPNTAQTEAIVDTVGPRAFCEQGGGRVTETGEADVYVCCYEEQGKCLVSNTRLNQSVLVELPWAREDL